jgi:hypothetical protein
MKKALSIVCVVLLMIGLLSSCGSRRGDKGCPNNFGQLEQNHHQSN